jgi:hypothetical protein
MSNIPLDLENVFVVSCAASYDLSALHHLPQSFYSLAYLIFILNGLGNWLREI